MSKTNTVFCKILAILCSGFLLMTSLLVGIQAGVADSLAAVVEKNAATPNGGTVSVKDGALSLAPQGTWNWVYTNNVNAMNFAADEDLDIAFDYTLVGYEWAHLFNVCIGGDAADKQWDSLVLALEGIGSGKIELRCLTDGFAMVKAIESPVVADTTFRFHITVDKATGTLKVWITPVGQAEAAEPLMTVTDAEYAAAGGAANMISTLNGGVNFGAQFKESLLDNISIIADGVTILDDGFLPVPVFMNFNYAVIEKNAATPNGGTVSVTDGALSLVPQGAWNWLYTNNVNGEDFKANESLDIAFDYTLVGYEWAHLFNVCIGGDAADKQWDSLVLALEGIGSGKIELRCLTDGFAMVKAIESPVVADTTFRFHITVDKATGTLKVWITPIGQAEAAEPLMTVTDAEYAAAGGAANMISTLNGGVNFGAQFKEARIDNISVLADGVSILNDDFSRTDFDLTDPSSEAGSYAKIQGGALKLFGWDANGAGKTVRTVGLLGRSDLSSYTVTLDYKPTDIAWNFDTILLGYKAAGNAADCLSLTFTGTGNDKKVKLRWATEEGFVELADASLTLEANKTYAVKAIVDAEAGDVDVTVTPDGGAPITLSLEDNAYIKTLKGDLGAESWAGNFTLDNIAVTPKAAGTTSTTQSTTSTTQSTTSTTQSTTSTTQSITSTTQSSTSTTQSSTSTTQTEQQIISSAVLDFDDSLKVANVALDKHCSASAGTVKAENGKLHLVAGNGEPAWSEVINSNAFKANENIEIAYDYYANNRDWSGDSICIGAKGDRQWGGYVLVFTSLGGADSTVELKNDALISMAKGGTTPMAANKLYRIRITLDKATGTLKVWATESGKKEGSPVLTHTDNGLKSLAGGVSFSGWASDYTVANLLLKANGKVLLNADFSTQPKNIGHKDNAEEGTAIISGGMLNLNGWNPAHTGGSQAITEGLFGVDGITSFDLSLDYAPADVAWSHDKVVMGYKNNGLEHGAMILELQGNPQKAVLQKNIDGNLTTLAEADLSLVAGMSYKITAKVDTTAGTAVVTVTPAQGAAVTLNATDDFIKGLKGDIALSSWGGNYAADNIALTAYGIELPKNEGDSNNNGGSAGDNGSQNGGNGQGGSASVDTGVALPVCTFVLLLCSAAVLFALSAKKENA